MGSMPEAEVWRRYLLDMGRAVRRRLMEVIERQTAGLATPVCFGGQYEGGDVIFRIDREAERAVEEFIAATGGEQPGFRFTAEGLAEGLSVFGRGEPRFHVLCDPIDGTRGIMYDKRSAWFLACAAPLGDRPTMLSEAIASVMVELPTSKQGWADEYSALRGSVAYARRYELHGTRWRGLQITPSDSADLSNGFGYVVDFFPGVKRLAADLMERIADAMTGETVFAAAKIYNDQYISTGGQMVELMQHDRFCCDLRPLLFRIANNQGATGAAGLCCHPYDCAGWLVAHNAGINITDGFGRELDAPFGVTQDVHWCGYANDALQSKIEPVIQAFLDEHGITPN